MEVNNYVRTKKGIAKIIDRINDPTNYYDKFWVCDRYLELNDDTEYIHEQDVIKCSPNIIDLIEVGDVIRYEIETPLETSGILKGVGDVTDDEMLKKLKKDKAFHVKSIVTKECFESMEYKVKE